MNTPNTPSETAQSSQIIDKLPIWKKVEFDGNQIDLVKTSMSELGIKTTYKWFSGKRCYDRSVDGHVLVQKVLDMGLEFVPMGIVEELSKIANAIKAPLPEFYACFWTSFWGRTILRCNVTRHHWSRGRYGTLTSETDGWHIVDPATPYYFGDPRFVLVRPRKQETK